MDLPEGLNSRPLVPADVDSVVAVAEAYDIATVGGPELEKADVESIWAMPNFDISVDSRGVFAGPDLLGFSQVVLGKYLEVCVHPDHHGRGIGTSLGTWGERKLAQDGAMKLFQSSPVTDKAALAIFEDRGYELAYTSWSLALPGTVAIPHRDLDPGYEVRPFVPGVEDEAVYELVQTAFGEWPDRERTPYDDWRALVVDREDFGPHSMLVATYDDAIVGMCFVIDGERSGWVQNVAVDRAHRNHGLAQVLLARAFEGTRSRGLERAELATDSRTGALGLYEKLGMHVTHSYEDWSLDLPTQSLSPVGS